MICSVFEVIFPIYLRLSVFFFLLVYLCFLVPFFYLFVIPEVSRRLQYENFFFFLMWEFLVSKSGNYFYQVVLTSWCKLFMCFFFYIGFLRKLCSLKCLFFFKVMNTTGIVIHYAYWLFTFSNFYSWCFVLEGINDLLIHINMSFPFLKYSCICSWL